MMFIVLSSQLSYYVVHYGDLFQLRLIFLLSIGNHNQRTTIKSTLYAWYWIVWGSGQSLPLTPEYYLYNNINNVLVDVCLCPSFQSKKGILFKEGLH